jgi:hypothetical protein
VGVWTSTAVLSVVDGDAADAELGSALVLLLTGAPGRRGGGWMTVAHEDGIVVRDAAPASLGAALREAIGRSTTTPVDD